MNAAVWRAWIDRFLARSWLVWMAGAVCIAFAPFSTHARITRVEVIATGTGESSPRAGLYEIIEGVAYGEVSPADPKNALITDIELAPRNARGNVEYAFQFLIDKPVDLSKGNGKVVYQPLPPAPTVNPTALDAAFLRSRGYTIVSSAWGQSPADPSPGITLPIAMQPDGSVLTGRAYDYMQQGGPQQFRFPPFIYPPATQDLTQLRVTKRRLLDDVPAVQPVQVLRFDPSGTFLITNGRFGMLDIGEVSYIAKNPPVNGLGLAAVRDWNAWLKYAATDDFGHRNPLAHHVKRLYSAAASHSARMLNDFRHLGFNQAESGKQVFDAMLQWLAGANGANLNYRFSQPHRSEHNRQDRLYAEGVFPFANVATTDPFTGTYDSRLARCEETQTCPLSAEVLSANEYWTKAASLLHTTPDGRHDLPDSRYARNYFVSSSQHGAGNLQDDEPDIQNRILCQNSKNSLDVAPVLRALFVALDEWSDRHRPPPRSAVPRLRHGTLAQPLPQAQMGFPSIPGVTYTGLKTTRYRFDFGPDFYTEGIPAINPPLVNPPYQDNPANGPIYPSYIPRTDADGNDIAGVRLVDVAVPLATYTGWSLRIGYLAHDGCEATGQVIAFPKTRAERLAQSDPRLSVAERYPTFESYRGKVLRAMNRLVARRFLLCEDTASEQTRLFKMGIDAGVPAPEGGVLPTPVTLAHCVPRHNRSDEHDDEPDPDQP
jgi:hypothetical protein